MSKSPNSNTPNPNSRVPANWIRLLTVLMRVIFQVLSARSGQISLVLLLVHGLVHNFAVFLDFFTIFNKFITGLPGQILKKSEILLK
jgi:hypothetical protein